MQQTTPKSMQSDHSYYGEHRNAQRDYQRRDYQRDQRNRTKEYYDFQGDPSNYANERRLSWTSPFRNKTSTQNETPHRRAQPSTPSLTPVSQYR